MKKQEHIADLLFTLALFCVFALSALTMVRMGTAVYGSTVDNMERGFSVQTSLSYVAEKVRQNDVSGAVRAGSIGGLPALVLTESDDADTCETWIYHYNGALYELYTYRGSEVHPEDGLEIIVVHDFLISESEGVYTFTADDGEGGVSSLSVYPRCG